MSAVSGTRPIRLVVRDDDLRRTRLTVLFRAFLSLPHLAWLALWGVAASVAALVLWLGVLIDGKARVGLHDFVAGYVRYATHVAAYLFLAADPFPGFRGAPGYPVDVEIDAPARQSRWTALVRVVLAFPALLLASALGGGLAWLGLSGIYVVVAVIAASAGAAGSAALLTWFAALARGRAPRGLRDLTAFALGYSAQASGYALLLTGRYPSTEPALAEPFSALPEHPVRILVADDLVRARLTVVFRLLLVLPHLFWVALWGIAALLAAVVAWLTGLAAGRVPSPLHRFLAAYVRYSLHVAAFVTLVGRRFPGFTGRAGSYQIEVELPEPSPQRRATIVGRALLAVPALIVASALGTVAWTVAFLAWWYALARGRMPEGLRNLGAACLRYNAQAYAYLLLVTGAYPYGAPVLGARSGVDEPSTAIPGDVL